MSTNFANEFTARISDPTQISQTLSKLADVAQPSAVYGAPVEAAGYTLITASEVALVSGFGFGLGVGAGSAPTDQGEAASQSGEGGGGGSGGGGSAMARPVAVISVGPDGVRIEPIVDVTKIGLAFFAALAGTLLIGRRRPR